MPNVTADQFGTYLLQFHRSLEANAASYLPERHRRRLAHAAALPCRVVGYVSTQFGVAIEYDPPSIRTGHEQTTVEVITGSRRIEDLVLRHAGAPAEMLRLSPAIAGIDNIQFTLIQIRGRVELRSVRSKAAFDRCFFAWPPIDPYTWSMGTSLLEMFGDRAAENWTVDIATARATQEVLAALFELRRSEAKGVSLIEYHREVRERTVLLLGSFSAEGRARLALIARAIAIAGYDPVTVEDVPDAMAQSVAQKVAMLGHLSKFVVVDDSEKSGHLREIEICRSNDWITVIMQLDGIPSSGMTRGLDVISRVIHEQPYTLDGLDIAMNKAVRWAERTFGEMKAKMTAAYPWVSADGNP